MRALRYFQVAARREHIGQAAAELRVAQPALSRAIARLEADLGVRLFDRHGRRVRLNRFGAMFLARVDRVLGELADAQAELADAAGLDRGSITVASETLLTLTGLLRAFLAAHPAVDVRLVQSDAHAMALQLRDGHIDLAFASQPLTGSPLGTQQILREEVLLAVPPAHPLAARSRVDVAALADEPLIATRPGYWQRTLTEDLFARAGLRPRIAWESNEPGATQDLISAGLGIGLVPAMSCTADSRAPVTWLHIDEPDCTRTLTVVWRTDAYLSTAARRLRDLAVRHFPSTTATSAPG